MSLNYLPISGSGGGGGAPSGPAGGALTGTYPNPILANLTTVGAIPYVSASGVLNQDTPGLHWDATNNRLGVGTASPAATADFVGTLRSAAVASSAGDPISGSGIELAYRSDLGYGQMLAYNRTGGTFLNLRITSAFTALTQGNVAIGTTTDLGFGLHAANKGTNGNLLVFDPTATTGTTKSVVRAGAGQSGNLMEWQNNAGTAVSFIASNGAANFASGWQVDGGGTVSAISTSMRLRNDYAILFSRSTNATDTVDTGIKRSAAGVLEINNGTAGQYRRLIASGYTSNYTAKTTTYTVVGTDSTIDCTSGTFTVTLLTAVGITGQVFNIKNSGAGTITVATTSSQTIDGAATATIAAGSSLTLQSTGANWIII